MTLDRVVRTVSLDAHDRDPDPSRARNMPAIRAGLVKRWRVGGAFDLAERVRVMDMTGRRMAPGPSWELRTLSVAELVWVAPELVDVLVAAANTVPDDAKLPPIGEWPFHAGLVVLGRSVYGHDAKSASGSVIVDGLVWGAASFTDTERGVGIGSLSRHHPIAPTMWLPLGRSDWLDGHPVARFDGPTWDAAGLTDEERVALIQSSAEDRRLILALWALMGMERVVDASTWTPGSRSSRRRPGHQSPVRVLHLRRTRTDGDTTDGDGTGESRFSHRWWVSGHWRWQRVGPGRSQRRLTWVDGHVKGPKDRPFVERPRVWSVDR